MTPSPEERTDFGAIDPLIVWINFMLGDTTSACAGSGRRHKETSESNGKNLERIFQLYSLEPYSDFHSRP
jgi:hypothetical protein